MLSDTLIDARRVVRWAKRQLATDTTDAPDLFVYRNDPVGYAKHVLGLSFLWEPVADALRSLLVPPYVVDVDSGHVVGKTHMLAIAANWWFDTRNPGVVITTAPTQRDVVDLLWTEIRLQRLAAGLSMPFIGPSAPEMRTGPEHFAKGYTARKGESFQGRHRVNQLFLFDEKEGIEASYFQTTKTMFRPGAGDAWMRVGNPTTTTSPAYVERRTIKPDGSPAAHLVRLSSLDHPNITEGLEGRALPVPGAVTPEQVDQWVADWCDPVPVGDEQPTDIRWRDRTWRPGPIAEPRILGLRPSAGTYGVWSEALWALTLRPLPADWDRRLPVDALPVVGCDVANYGDDYTAVHTRIGGVSLRHHAANGWDAPRIADHLRREAAWAAAWLTKRRDMKAAPVSPKVVPLVIEDDATGRAVQPLLRADGYRVIPCNASSTPRRPDLYRNVRSELWFTLARLACEGLVNFSLLDRASRARLEQQALAPEWWPTQAGQREVEPKADTKQKLGRSPDDMDGANAAYYPAGLLGTPSVPEREPEYAQRWKPDTKRPRAGQWGR